MTTTGNAIRVERDGDIAVALFDLPGEPVNKLTRSVIKEFDAMLDAVERDASVRGLVFMSGKDTGFIAGADIEEFLTFTTVAMASGASAEGQIRFTRLETLRVPVVAAIHGACMGGGLEMALACRYRIATEHAKTVLALPEVQIGLIPGLGGTQRLPRVVGLRAALDMILTGKNIRAKKAQQIGLVHEVVHPALLRAVAVQRARELGGVRVAAEARIAQRPPTGRRRESVVGRILDDTAPGRAVVFAQARKAALAKTRGNYPALPAAISAVKAGLRSAEAGYAAESRLFGEMAMTAVSRNLISIFFATNALKKDSGVAAGGPAPRDITRIGVLGTGFMGAGIAAVAAQAGSNVRFKDVSAAQVGKGLAAVRDVLRERLKKKQVTASQHADELSLVAGTTSYHGFANLPLSIEAVFEDLAVKHGVLREVEAATGPDAIFATNTSTIPIAEVARSSARPERVIGMHFFSPVHKMPLLEVIVTPTTAPDVVTTVVAYGRRIGKTVIVVNDSPGFFVNRILAPYLNEVGRLLEEGVAIDAIDRAMLDWGFPVGPVALLDEVGLDVAGKSGGIFHAAFGERLRSSEGIKRLLDDGRLGRKNKRGFYRYDDRGRKRGVDESVYALLAPGVSRRPTDAEAIQERLSLIMLNEAMRCLDERVVRQARDGDIGAIFGIGYPPFRGGPFRTIDAIGAAGLVQRLETLEQSHPDRFAPCDALVRLAQSKGSIYGSLR
ncbi:MAG: fatty acid oxidation complex subunit alpha FadJ [Gemmatimonadetes bacterium]|nr:fatty acid oxidation complex subunit alpha FadJ [Gemmatimonadota bacterium]